MSKADDAAARFNEGFSCSQAVVSSFAGDQGLDTDTAYRISCGFGAGIARTGNTCGAVAGAVMVIGQSANCTKRIRSHAIKFQDKKDLTVSYHIEEKPLLLHNLKE